MSDVVKRFTARGNVGNFKQAVDVEIFRDGYVRIQQDGNPVDVVLLTPQQVRRIAAAMEKAL